MYRHVPILFLAVCQLCFSAGAWASGINLIQNGDFTAGTTTVNFEGTIDNLPNGWTNDPPDPNQSTTAVNVVTSFFLNGSGISAPSGYSGNFVAFQSHSTVGQGTDCLFEDLPTTPGAWYNLTFDLAITGSATALYMAPDWDANGTDRQVFYGLANGEYSNAASQSSVGSSGSVPFQQFSLDVQASLSTTRLFFHGVDNGGPSSAILLANVSLTQDVTAPEPATSWLIGTGLMILAIAGWFSPSTYLHKSE